MTESTTHKRAKAVRLREQGWTHKAIAEHLDVSRSTIYRWCNPERVAVHEQNRRARKEQWHRDHYHGVCRSCGGDTSQPRAEMCQACYAASRNQARETLLNQIADLYNAGTPVAEIAQRLGRPYSKGAFGRELQELRRQGRIGYRLDPERVQRMRDARWKENGRVSV